MKKLYILFSILIIATTCLSQSCLSEGITFSTQEQIDNFQTNYPGCNKIRGYVRIEDGITNLNGLNSIQVIVGYLRIADTDNLQNLDGLESLDSIGTIPNDNGYFGGLYIGDRGRDGPSYPNESLSNIDGLSGLSYVGSSVRILYNPLLENLNGLNNLTSIEGATPPYNGLGIGHNDNLTDLNGLINITSIGGDLRIYDNNNLTDLNGLNNLISIESSLWITGNSNLTDLNGFNNLSSIGGWLDIEYNSLLENLDGLENLTSIEGHLYISENDNLTDLNGLINITSIEGDLFIMGLTNLTDLNGLNNLSSIGDVLGIVENDGLIDLNGLNNLTSIGGSIDISYNISLSECEIQSICAYLENPNGNVYISDNATGCNSVAEVEDACNLVGIDEINLFSSVSIYPNPNTGLINIDLGSLTDVSIKVLNVSGQLIYYKENINSPIYQFELDAAPGIYILELSAVGEKQQFKIIKSK